MNKDKSAVARPWKRKFLGLSSQKVFGKIRIAVPKEKIKRFRENMKKLFHEGRGRNVASFIKERINPVLRGWFQYFSIGLSLKQVNTLDFWIRRRFRCLIWRQWKRPPTRIRKLLSLGIAQNKGCYANNRRGPWWNAGLPVLTQALSPEYFNRLELFSFVDNLKKLRTTLT